MISYLKSMQLQKYHEFGKYLDIRGEAQRVHVHET